MYKCWRCGARIKENITQIGIQCDKCGCKIFLKERPSVKKVVKAR